jgi:hypothetical protein
MIVLNRKVNIINGKILDKDFYIFNELFPFIEKRGVLNCNDKFLKFISKDGTGLSQFPTIIFLTNRLFLKEEAFRIGKHEGVTETIKAGDDFVWYKTSNPKIINDAIASTLSDEDTYAGTHYFKIYQNYSNLGIKNYWNSGKIHYMHIGNNLAASDYDPFFDSRNIVEFPPDASSDNFVDSVNNIVDICRLDDTNDLILTKTRLYKYNYSSNKMTQRLKVSIGGNATAMCMTQNYAIVTCSSGEGFFIITNINSPDNVSLSYKKPRYVENPNNNGLNPSNSYTFCFPLGKDIVEINGGRVEEEVPSESEEKPSPQETVTVDVSCKFDCAAWINNNSYKAPSGKTRCVKSINFGNEVVLFSNDTAYAKSGNKYSLNKGSRFFKSNEFILFIGKSAKNAAALTASTTTSLDNKKAATFYEDNGVPPNIVSGYVKDKENIFLFTPQGTVYKSIDKSSVNNGSVIFSVAFDYNKEKATEKADVAKNVICLSSLIELLDGGEQSPITTVNKRKCNFIFIRNVSSSGHISWFCYGDDNRRDSELAGMMAAFDVG